MHFILYPFIFFLVPIFFMGQGNFFVASSQAAGGLPSQQARFEGMGATFKAKKKEATALSAQMMSENSNEKNTSSSNDSPTYFKLHTFVVNVIDQKSKDKLTFLTLEIYIKISDPDEKWIIDHHMAAIKDVIITYISGLNRQTIQTQKQKKTLQKKLTMRVYDRLKKLSGKTVISDLYLTRILVQ